MPPVGVTVKARLCVVAAVGPWAEWAIPEEGFTPCCARGVEFGGPDDHIVLPIGVDISGGVQAVAEQGKGWLLIDDLVDTGTTAKEALRLLPKAHFATVYAKPQGLPYVNTYSHDVQQDVWVFFPWDTEPQYIKPIAGKM